MRNPYRIHTDKPYTEDMLRAMIFPFATIFQGIDIDKKILKKRNAPLTERIKHHIEFSVCLNAVQLGVFSLSTYAGYNLAHQIYGTFVK